jgi:hypothetical protein
MAEQQGKNFFKSATGIAISLAVLFGTVWVISKAWKSGQKNS